MTTPPQPPAPRPAANSSLDSSRAIPRLPDGVAPPPSFAQERVWFFEHLTEGAGVHGVYIAVRLRGPLQLAVLGRAVQIVATRHDSLRMCFPTVDGRPAVKVLDTVQVPWRVVSAADAAQARTLLGQVGRFRFDITTGPLVRVSVIRLGDADHVLHVLAHHIITDGWSHALLLDDIAAVYASLVGHGTDDSGSGDPGGEDRLPCAPKVRYGDFAAWQRERLTGPVAGRDVGYWREVLSGVPPLELAMDRPRPAEQRYLGAGFVVELEAELTSALRRLARAQRVSLFVVLLGGFAAVLSRASDQEDFAIGIPVAHRTTVELENVIGLLVNTLAIRVDLSGSPSFATLLHRVRERVLGALAHQEVPFERVVQELAVPRDLSRMPVYQVIFALQNFRSTTGTWPDELHAEWFDVPSDISLFDLSLTLTDLQGELSGWLAYNTDLFDHDRIACLFQRMTRLLTAAAANPEASLADLDAGGWAGEEGVELDAGGWAGEEGVELDAGGWAGEEGVELDAAPDRGGDPGEWPADSAAPASPHLGQADVRDASAAQPTIPVLTRPWSDS